MWHNCPILLKEELRCMKERVEQCQELLNMKGGPRVKEGCIPQGVPVQTPAPVPAVAAPQ